MPSNSGVFRPLVIPFTLSAFREGAQLVPDESAERGLSAVRQESLFVF